MAVVPSKPSSASNKVSWVPSARACGELHALRAQRPDQLAHQGVGRADREGRPQVVHLLTALVLVILGGIPFAHLRVGEPPVGATAGEAVEMDLLPDQRIRHRVLREHDVQVGGDQRGKARQPVQQPEETSVDLLVTTEARRSVLTGDAQEMVAFVDRQASIVLRDPEGNKFSPN